MNEKIALVLDCGATNVRSVAIDRTGKIIAQKSYPNATKTDPFFKKGLIWDADEIWRKLMNASREVTARINKEQIAAVTVDTFGVDGAPVNKNGELLYPVISWACQRTAPIMDNIDRFIPVEELYKKNGLYPFSYATINKLIWLKENHPEILEQMDYFAFLSSIFNHRLTNVFATETSMAGTSMLTDLLQRDFSSDIFSAIGIENKFPKMVEPGAVIGQVTAKASNESGIPVGTPVVASGHDTQFAVFGSGARENQPVLSSGTWEILMVRTAKVHPDIYAYKNDVTIEWDAIPGMFNPGVQWLASGILEWVKRTFYKTEADQPDIYDIMIEEARQVGESGVTFNIDFLNNKGGINGLGINVQRAEIYRAALEALSQRTGEGVEILQKIGSFKADSILVVGGGAKNKFWNQLRANALNIPVEITEQSETTVAGAAMFAFAGAGVFASPEEAREQMKAETVRIEPEG